MSTQPTDTQAQDIGDGLAPELRDWLMNLQLPANVEIREDWKAEWEAATAIVRRAFPGNGWQLDLSKVPEDHRKRLPLDSQEKYARLTQVLLPILKVLPSLSANRNGDRKSVV